MLWYLNQIKCLLGGFHSFTLEQVPRSKNSHADSLATLATTSKVKLPRIILVEDLVSPTYNAQVLIRIYFMRVGPSWMDPVVTFLTDGTLPKDNAKADKI